MRVLNAIYYYYINKVNIKSSAWAMTDFGEILYKIQ